MRELFGPASRPIMVFTTTGLVLAGVAAALPAFLVVLVVLRQLLHSAGPEWLVAVVADPRNIQALGNSLSVGASVAPILFCAAAGLAILINRFGMTGDRYVYALALIPMLIPDYMVGVAGRALVEPQFGLLSGVLPDRTLSVRFDALSVLVLFVAMKWLPVMMVVVDARLAAIPQAILLQAELDFGSTVRKMRIVVMPEVLRTAPLILAFGFLIGFRQHELSTELTGHGGGFSAEIWSNWNYRTIYEFFQLPAGAAQALLTLAVLLIPIEALRLSARRKGRE